MFIDGRRAISSIQLEIMRKGRESQFLDSFQGLGWKEQTGSPRSAKDGMAARPPRRCVEVAKRYYFLSSLGSFFFLVLAFFFVFSVLAGGSSGRANDTAARPVSNERPSMAVINFFIFAFLLWSDDVLV